MKTTTAPLFRHHAENLLMAVASRRGDIPHVRHEDGSVTLTALRRDFIGKLSTTLLHKQATMDLHLDPLAARVWDLCDGTRSVHEIGKVIYGEFGDLGDPVQERVAREVLNLERWQVISLKGS